MTQIEHATQAWVTEQLEGFSPSSDAADITFDDAGRAHITHTNVQQALADLDAAIPGADPTTLAADVTVNDSGLTHITHTNVQAALADLDSAVGTGGAASGVTFDDSGRAHITHTTVQDALDDLDAAIPSSFAGTDVTIDDSGLTHVTHVNVQDAIADLDAAVGGGGGGGGDAADTTYDDSGRTNITHTNVQDALTDLDNAIASGGGDPYMPISSNSGLANPGTIADFTTYDIIVDGTNLPLMPNPLCPDPSDNYSITINNGADFFYDAQYQGYIFPNVPGLWKVSASVEMIGVVPGDILVVVAPDGVQTQGVCPPGQTTVSVGSVCTLAVEPDQLGYLGSPFNFGFYAYSAQSGVQIDEQLIDLTLLMAINGASRATTTDPRTVTAPTGATAAASGTAGEIDVTWAGASSLTGDNTWQAYAATSIKYDGNVNVFTDSPVAPTDTTTAITGLTTGVSYDIFVQAVDDAADSEIVYVSTVTAP